MKARQRRTRARRVRQHYLSTTDHVTGSRMSPQPPEMRRRDRIQPVQERIREKDIDAIIVAIALWSQATILGAGILIGYRLYTRGEVPFTFWEVTRLVVGVAGFGLLAGIVILFRLHKQGLQ